VGDTEENLCTEGGIHKDRMMRSTFYSFFKEHLCAWKACMTSLKTNYTSEGKRNVANLTEIFTNTRKKRWHGRKMRVKE